MVERSRRRRDMNNMTTMRMLLSTAALAAFAAVLAGGANAKLDEGGSGGGAPTVTTVIPYLSHGIGVDQTQFATPTSPGFTGVHHGIESRVFWSGATDEAVRVDRAVAAANEAYNEYRDKTATAAREALFTDQQPSVQFRGAHRGLRPGRLTPPTTSSASDGVDWSWLALGVGMTALLAAGIAGVVLTTRRRGSIALP
jgi:hypothetical protein